MAIKVSDPAPGFEAKDQDGNVHSLEDYRGSWLLLYFYPKDDTPGCTTEACGFRDIYMEFQGRANILGISADDMESHMRFREKYHLPFPLLSDTDRRIHKMYGVRSTFGKRVSFLIDPEGKIAKIYDNVDASTHAKDVLMDLASSPV